MATASEDHLLLAKNTSCQKMLLKMGTFLHYNNKKRKQRQQLFSKMLGNNFPIPEKIIFSDNLIKINKRGKEQERVLLITDKAVYNLKPKEYHKCQRRIDIDKIVSISEAKDSDEFTVHVPEEYDYRYKTKSKHHIIEIISEQFELLSKNTAKLKVNSVTAMELEKKTLTKDEAKLQTREQRYQRYLDLIAAENFDEEVADAKENCRKTVAMKGYDSVDQQKVQFFSFLCFHTFLLILKHNNFFEMCKTVLICECENSKEKRHQTSLRNENIEKKYLIEKRQVDHTNEERRILMSLQHPFLMQLRYAFQTESKLYFVLDFYKGGELFFHLKKMKKFSEPQTRFLVAEVGCALGHLHSLDIVYRDLKPENILLDSSGHICLTDFGLAKELGGDAVSTTFCGTPEYLDNIQQYNNTAPEVISNAGHGKPVDWWTLGILLYELSVGMPPFYDQNVHKMYTKIQTAPLQVPTSLSDNCRDLIVQVIQLQSCCVCTLILLGSGKDDFKEIQAHAFWENLDWEKLLSKDVDPPYKPKIKSDDTDVTNFDPAFLRQKPLDSNVAPPVLSDGVDGFEDFSYPPPQR
ncbi:hypothetical protein RFI_13487 [Reticulomyxa filosa]|uniref:Uncharacterized protein n=1 Tax=Reticulomyxa filosa TaxID=46433 RepID=X6NEB7_RETFI|nr:hypothetical protein RFI_13487 [Reticulomyxa filosa]|eukprot:ETO23692.1 hypothetical protein RFI_13487 [Reticulomyxa filosa]